MRLSMISLCFLLAGCIYAPLPAPPQQPIRPQHLGSTIPLPLAYNVYFPIAANNYVAPAQATCFDNPKTLAVYQLLAADSRQQHPALRCNHALMVAAAQRARGLADGGPWAHQDAQGIGPNEYARKAGCRLPPDYGNGRANSIESLTAGMSDPVLAFESLARSPSHAAHLFGLSDFYRKQTDIGIGYAQGAGTYQFYWVFLLGTCEVYSGE